MLSKPYALQINMADIIVGNMCDVATPEEIADFIAWGCELFPPKAQVSLFMLTIAQHAIKACCQLLKQATTATLQIR
jgi:predicted GTPase